MNNPANFEADPVEQIRADRLAQAIDQVLNGEPAAFDDPLLSVVRDLQQLPFEPSAAAIIRFDQQVSRWFAHTAPAAPVRTIPGWLIGLAAGLIIAFAGITLHQTVFVPPPIASATLALTPSNTSTLQPTLTVTAVASHTPTNTITTTVTASASAVLTRTPTALAFNHIVISGIIQAINDTTIVIYGQAIQVNDGVGGLCVGDFVSLEATSAPDATWHATRKAITVLISSCTILPHVQPANPLPNNNGGNSDNDQPKKHHDD